jgi:hypothetical protein
LLLINVTICRRTSSIDVLTSVASNSPTAASSSFATARRRSHDVERFGTAAGEPADEFGPEGLEERQQRVVLHGLPHLPGTGQASLKQGTESLLQAFSAQARRGAVFAASELRPLKKFSGAHHAGKLGAVHKMVFPSVTSLPAAAFE